MLRSLFTGQFNDGKPYYNASAHRPSKVFHSQKFNFIFSHSTNRFYFWIFFFSFHFIWIMNVVYLLIKVLFLFFYLSSWAKTCILLEKHSRINRCLQWSVGFCVLITLSDDEHTYHWRTQHAHMGWHNFRHKFVVYNCTHCSTNVECSSECNTRSTWINKSIIVASIHVQFTPYTWYACYVPLFACSNVSSCAKPTNRICRRSMDLPNKSIANSAHCVGKCALPVFWLRIFCAPVTRKIIFRESCLWQIHENQPLWKLYALHTRSSPMRCDGSLGCEIAFIWNDFIYNWENWRKKFQ